MVLRSIKLIISLLFLMSFSPSVFSETSTLPKFGKKKSDQYFIQRDKKRKANNTVNVAEDPYSEKSSQNKYAQSSRMSNPEGSHVMAIQAGLFLDDKSHSWGEKSTNEDVGQWNVGVTYLMGEWVNSMDLSFRGDLQGYKIDDDSANKLSLLGVVTFPDVRSGFPVYFGAGLGVGIFFDQIDDESSVSIDYQLLFGIRILDVYEGIGFIAEAGAKNHLFLTSQGQFNGYFFSMGAIFRF